MKPKATLSVKGFLLHVTHYDPHWMKTKTREKPFDLRVALDVVEAMAQAGLNLLVVDCADGVRYRSHPELARPYTVPMDHLRALADRARELNIDVVPKLNFSQGLHVHNLWFRPYNELYDNDEYWRVAFELIDELIDACRPARFFHIGMDEENHRSYRHYVRAIKTLRAGLRQRKLRTVVWNDTALENSMWDQFAEKCLVAERQLPKDVVQVPWCYDRALPNVVKRLVGHGFDVWGAPGPTAERIQAWKRDILRLGGKGLLFTRWIPCIRKNRKELLNLIKTAGEVCG